MNLQVDLYLSDGCGRCSLVSTPKCKVYKWAGELKLLRSIALSCGLTEQLKWSMPCYTHYGRNIFMIAAFKEYAAISFFKGSLLSDTNNILSSPGENSQATRQIRVTSIKQIVDIEPVVKAYIFEAIEIEKMGLKVEFKKSDDLEITEELQLKMDELPAFKLAFDALTPGRQRAYLLYFSGAKQVKTRLARIEKYTPFILKGKGLND